MLFGGLFECCTLLRSLWVSRKCARAVRAHSGLSHLEGEGKALETHRADLTFFFFCWYRMFREPSSTEASKGHHLKDPSAAARSSIRRQPTLRRSSRYGGPTLRGAHHSHHPHRLLRPPFQDSMTSNSILNRRSIGDILAREARVLGYPMASPQDENPFDDSVDAHRREGQRLLADAARHSQPGRRLRIPRDTTTLSELINRQSPGDGLAGQQQQQQNTSEHPPFSRRFAPAIAYHNAISYPSNDFNDMGRMTSTPPASQRVPHLRRVVEQSINDLNRVGRESAIDGLGDRERSLSPGVDDNDEDDDDHAHDAWATLLTTITPDANLPSNESSFASASASATDPSRHRAAADSAGSASQTLPLSASLSGRDREPTRMVLNPYPEYLNPCDYPTSSDSESDSELNLDESHRSRRRRRTRTPHLPSMDTLRQTHDLNSTMSSQPPPVSTFSFSFYDSTSDPDFQQMQAILDRLSRREEIPEHWWAAAGLSRTVGRRLGAGDETPEPNSADGPSRPIL